MTEVGPYTVRDLNPWDAPRVFRLTGNPDVTKYLGFHTHVVEQQASELIARHAGNPQAKWLAVCSKNDETDVLGLAGFEVQGHQATITIMFRPDRAARGAGRAFSKPFVQWVFTHPKIWRVWAYCHVDNIPVQRVLERMGAEREGRLRRFEFFPNVSDEPQDVYVYAITRRCDG